MKFLSALITLATLALARAEIKDIPSTEFVKNLKIGWNLGNTLDADCQSWLDYSVDQTASEVCWGNPVTTKELFTKLMETGFNTFRIPTTYSGHFGEGPDYKINEDWINRVQEIVNYAYDQGAYVIINLHHETWNDAFSDNLENAKVIHEAIWTQLSEKFKDYDEHLIFEGMNEVRKKGTPVEWNGGDEEGWNFINEMNQLFVDVVRQSGGNNALRQLMVPTYAASATEAAFGGFVLPPNDDKLLVSVHAYTPYNFALNNGEGATTVFDAPQDVDYVMSIIDKYFIQKNVPVVLGEFGAMNRNNQKQRKIWANYYVSKAAEIGVPTVWWDNGVFEGEGERFSVINRNTLEIVSPDVIIGLMTGANGEELPVEEETTTTVIEETTTVTTLEEETLTVEPTVTEEPTAVITEGPDAETETVEDSESETETEAAAVETAKPGKQVKPGKPGKPGKTLPVKKPQSPPAPKKPVPKPKKAEEKQAKKWWQW